MSEPGPTPAEAAPSRLEKVLRKSLSTDPRMPIRLDRAAWRRPTPESQDETEQLVTLPDEEMRQDLGDVVEAAMKAMDAAPAPRLRRYRLRPERAMAHAIIETHVGSASEPAAPPALRETPAAAPGGVSAPPITMAAAAPLPEAVPQLAPPSGRSTRLVIALLTLPWPQLWAGGALFVALALGCHQIGRSEAMDALRAQLLVLDRPAVLSDAQLGTCKVALERYRQLAASEDPDVTRWAMALQR